MTQPGLFSSSPVPRTRKAGHVPRSSVIAGQQVNRDGRAHAVVEWLTQLERYMNRSPTSAELARYRWIDQGHRGPVGLECVLFTRRGLSDALARGFVEHVPHGERKCAVSGKTCVTWRLRTR